MKIESGWSSRLQDISHDLTPATARSKNVSIFTLVHSLKEKKAVTVQINIVHNTLSIMQR
jgi:hypothetical protein